MMIRKMEEADMDRVLEIWLDTHKRMSGQLYNEIRLDR